MEIPADARIIMYAVGFSGAIAVSASSFRIKHLMALLLGISMVAWASFCLMLGFAAYMAPHGVPFPEWYKLHRSFNTVLFATVPLAFYAGIWWGGRDGHT